MESRFLSSFEVNQAELSVARIDPSELVAGHQYISPWVASLFDGHLAHTGIIATGSTYPAVAAASWPYGQPLLGLCL